MRREIECFRPVADAIATLFAPYVEVVIYDVRARAVAYVANHLVECDDATYGEINLDPASWQVRSITDAKGHVFRSVSVKLSPQPPLIGIMAVNFDAEAFPGLAAPSLAEVISRQGPSLAPVRGGLAPHNLRAVMDYIDQSLAEPVRLSDLGEITGLSPKHFARAFAQSTGHPPHRWLIDRRIAAARELLKESDQPLSQVAIDCGFADQSHFTSCFRKIVGVSPGRYRATERSKL